MNNISINTKEVNLKIDWGNYNLKLTLYVFLVYSYVRNHKIRCTFQCFYFCLFETEKMKKYWNFPKKNYIPTHTKIYNLYPSPTHILYNKSYIQSKITRDLVVVAVT